MENILVGLHSHLKSGFFGIVLNLPATRKEEKEATEEARASPGFVNLAGKGDFLAKNLPYGDQRRLEIARALATRPKLLLLDEPTAGMNPSETQEMMDFIQHLRDELGDHDPSDRAPDAGRDGNFGNRDRAGLWQERSPKAHRRKSRTTPR